jgi:Do/DeqQ family serine protease
MLSLDQRSTEASGMRNLTVILAAVLLAVSLPARAQDAGQTIRDAVGNLLRGGAGAESAASESADANNRVVPDSMAQVQLSFAPVVRKTAPSVVNVNAARTEQVSRSPFAGDPFFERFFGSQGFGGPQRRRNPASLGSGVIVSEDGVILTNNHVIENADQVKVSLSDGREFDCDIVLKDPKSDLAVLRVRDKVKLQPIEIADSDNVAVGDLVLAIGNPFGVGQTVTLGIVSAVSRSLAGINDYGYFLQTDAAINPGNSGGALVDMDGRLIGINTAIYSRSGGSVGIGYAIPSNMTQIVLRSASVGGAVIRPWLGADFQSVTSEISESMGLTAAKGAIVTGVISGGPADRVGLERGDVVISLNKQPVDNADSLGYRLDTTGVGNVARLEVFSRGKSRTVEINLEAPPETVPRDEREMPENSPLRGGRFANLSPAVALQAGISADKTGVVALNVERNSPAALNGLRPGDILRGVNGEEVKDTKGLETVVSTNSRAWQFIVEREGRIFIFERNGAFFRQYIR